MKTTRLLLLVLVAAGCSHSEPAKKKPQ